MLRRGMNHKSPILRPPPDEPLWPDLITPLRQIAEKIVQLSLTLPVVVFFLFLSLDRLADIGYTVYRVRKDQKP
jgi:hypothetical protein